MPGYLRIDNFDAVSDNRVSEYLDDTRSIAGLAHVVDATHGSGAGGGDFLFPDKIGRFEARLDRDSEGGGTIGRFQTGLAQVYIAMTQDLFGNAYRDMGASGGSHAHYVFFQPFAIPPFGRNAISVRGVKELEYLLDFDLDDAVLDAYEHRLYAVVTDDVPEAYIPHIDQKDLDFSGNNDHDDVTFQSNVTHVAVNDPDLVLEELQVTRDGETVVEDIPALNPNNQTDEPRADLYRLNHMFANADNPHEGSTDDHHNDTFVLDVLQGSSPESSLAQTVNIEGQAQTAGDVNLFAVSLDFENARDEASLAATIGRFERAVQLAENLPTGEARQELPQPILRRA